DQNVCRLDVLMDEPALVELAQRHGDANREAKAASDLQGRLEQPVEGLAAGVLEHQHDPAPFADEFHRPHRPGAVELVLQLAFMGEAIEEAGRGMLRGRNYGKYAGPPAAIRL